MDKVYDLTIIGAGAAGLFNAASYEGSCCILEKNSEAAKKIYATGNGRCNYLNVEADSSCYNNPDFVEAVFEMVSPDDLYWEFTNIGVIGSEEENGRMYPRSNEAKTIARALINAASNADIKYNFEVKSAKKEEDIFIVESTGGQIVRSLNLLIATGGKAGIQFGSDGRGLKIAQSFGHNIIKPIPALAPMTCSEDISSLAGVRVEAMINLIKHSENRDEIIAFEYFGEVQFTKDAISGICVMDLARNIKLEEGVKYTLTVNPFWDYEKSELEDLLKDYPLENLIPEKLANYMKQGKNLSFTITGTKGWPDAQTTAGGVDVNEINVDTMESKLVPGLYFAGEVIDVDGYCGGFNLTWAFASALIAARSIND
ncbi:MAG: aminoacetone oxidase family FAD-binding enzyme [Bacillota bacterium]|nr:aminoacetone oxidase family FAD-binding enzyme [Bacillota bacterium]